MTGPVAVAAPPGYRAVTPVEGRPVVVRVPNWIGDAVLVLPALAAIVDHFREAGVIVVARPVVAPLFKDLPGMAQLVVVRGGGALRFASVRAALAGRATGAGVVFPNSMGSAIELAGGRVPRLWGYGGGFRRLVLDTALPRRWLRGRHRWEGYALLAAAVTGAPVEERYPITLGSGDEAAAEELLAEADAPAAGGPLVGLVPGAHAWSRRWPADRFSMIASRLGRDGARVVVFGSPAETDLTARVAAAADPPAFDAGGRTTLPVLAACFARIDFLLTNDTGSMHLAAAVGTPLLDLCGAASEVVTAPRGPASDVVVHPIHCRPCVKNVCAYDLECLRGLDVDGVEVLIRPRIRAGGRTAT